jgi:hypothetical protein
LSYLEVLHVDAIRFRDTSSSTQSRSGLATLRPELRVLAVLDLSVLFDIGSGSGP